MEIFYFFVFSLLICAGIVFYLIKRYSPGERKFLIWGSLISLGLRLGIVFLTTVFPKYLLSSDAGGYESVGMALSEALKRGHLLDSVPLANFSYYFLHAGVYMIFGFHPVILRVLNCAFGIFAALLLYDTAKDLKGERTGKAAFILLAFWPSLIFYSTLNLKDTLILLLIVYVLKHFFNMMNRLSTAEVAKIFLAIIILFSLRVYIGMIALAIFVVLFAVMIKMSLTKKIISVVVFIILWGIITHFLNYGFMGSKFFDLFNLNVFNSHRQQLLEKYSSSNSNIFLDVRMYSIWDALKFLPVGLVYFLFAPFPWQISGVLQIASLPENLVWYILVIAFFIPGLKFFFHRDNVKKGIFMLVFSGVITVLYSLMLDNLGIAYRMKFQILPFWFLVISVGMDFYLGKYGPRVNRKYKSIMGEK